MTQVSTFHSQTPMRERRAKALGPNTRKALLVAAMSLAVVLLASMANATGYL